MAINVSQGDSITYTLVINNSSGFATATSVVVTDQIDLALVSYVSATPTPDVTFPDGSGNLQWTLADILPSGSSQIQYTVTADAAGTFNNTGIVTHDDGSNNDSESAIITVSSVTVVKTVNNNAINIDDEISTYTITVNVPSGTAQNIVVVDTIPIGLKYWGNTTGLVPTSQPTVGALGGTIQWNFGTMTAESSVVTYKVKGAAEGVQANDADLTFLGGTDTDTVNVTVTNQCLSDENALAGFFTTAELVCDGIVGVNENLTGVHIDTDNGTMYLATDQGYFYAVSANPQIGDCAVPVTSAAWTAPSAGAPANAEADLEGVAQYGNYIYILTEWGKTVYVLNKTTAYSLTSTINLATPQLLSGCPITVNGDPCSSYATVCLHPFTPAAGEEVPGVQIAGPNGLEIRMDGGNVYMYMTNMWDQSVWRVQLDAGASPAYTDVVAGPTGTRISTPFNATATTKGDAEGAVRGSVELTAGTAGNITGITVNSIQVMDGVPEPFDTSLAQTAINVAANITAFTSTPNYVAEAVGAVIEINNSPADSTAIGLAVACSFSGDFATTNINTALEFENSAYYCNPDTTCSVDLTTTGVTQQGDNLFVIRACDAKMYAIDPLTGFLVQTWNITGFGGIPIADVTDLSFGVVNGSRYLYMTRLSGEVYRFPWPLCIET